MKLQIVIVIVITCQNWIMFQRNDIANILFQKNFTTALEYNILVAKSQLVSRLDDLQNYTAQTHTHSHTHTVKTHTHTSHIHTHTYRSDTPTHCADGCPNLHSYVCMNSLYKDNSFDYRDISLIKATMQWPAKQLRMLTGNNASVCISKIPDRKQSIKEREREK